MSNIHKEGPVQQRISKKKKGKPRPWTLIHSINSSLFQRQEESSEVIGQPWTPHFLEIGAITRNHRPRRRSANHAGHQKSRGRMIPQTFYMNQSDDSEMRPAHLAVLSLQGPLREISLVSPGIKSQGSSGKYLTVNRWSEARAGGQAREPDSTTFWPWERIRQSLCSHL